MNRKQFKELNIGDHVIIKGNKIGRIKHNFQIGQTITIDRIEHDYTVWAHDEYALLQWVSRGDIELVEEMKNGID